MPTASSNPRSPMFKVPHIMRMADPEGFEPILFHLGPYAPKFFAPLTGFTANSSSCNSSAAMGLPQTGECSLPSSIFNLDHGSCFQESMARDITGDAAFESLVRKLSEGTVLKEITAMYPELPNTMFDAIRTDTLARLFASSALIIVGSALSLLGLTGHLRIAPPADVPGAPPTTIRHPFINREYAVQDAIRTMENQVPASLLKLACDTFCNDECRLRVLEIRDMQLLVHVLWKCQSLASPFYVENEKEEDDKQLQKIASWLETNPHKSVMAYIYDSLTGRLSDTDEAENIVKDAADAEDIRIPTDDDVDPEYRMMSASQLRRYGVTFHTSPDVTGNNFKGITYDSKTRKLVLPTMDIWDDVQPFLLNLMAYEATLATTFESYRDMVCDVSSFVFFLDCLIDTEEDVEVLVEAGVLRNNMARSNARVAKLFDGLDKSMYADLTPEISRIVNELRDACKGRWRRWWVSFKEVYWERQPWLLISVAAATVLLVMTTLQTIYTARS